MSQSLHWQRSENQLTLVGELNQQTLLPLWQQRDAVMKGINALDLTGLTRVDSAGVALLVHLIELARQHGLPLRFTGINQQLNSLIALYNLQHLFRLPTRDEE